MNQTGGMWDIIRYSPERTQEWNSFVAGARNSTFLFSRNYMDYHSSRFQDFSLMAYRNGKLAGVLPANRHQNDLYSHQGLTYGGWVWEAKGIDGFDIYSLWKLWLAACEREGIERIIYKPLPFIYAEMPSEEDRYMLFLSDARLVRTDLSSAIDFACNPGFNKLQKRHLKKASEGIHCLRHETSDHEAIEEFHRVITRCLHDRHGATPVHSLEEMKLLISRFPDNIRLWGAYDDYVGDMLGGVLVYETKTCIHCQYIATTERGRAANALSLLFSKMLSHYEASGARYFDFGISNENGGRLLNSGLNRQKTSYGASGVAYVRYDINVSSALKSLPSELWPPK